MRASSDWLDSPVENGFLTDGHANGRNQGPTFNRCNFSCFEYLLTDKDIVAVPPTGFGKSLLLMRVHISNP